MVEFQLNITFIHLHFLFKTLLELMRLHSWKIIYLVIITNSLLYDLKKLIIC